MLCWFYKKFTSSRREKTHGHRQQCDNWEGGEGVGLSARGYKGDTW